MGGGKKRTRPTLALNGSFVAAPSRADEEVSGGSAEILLACKWRTPAFGRINTQQQQQRNGSRLFQCWKESNTATIRLP